MEDVRRPDLKSDYQYLTLMCEARLALAGSAVPGGGSDPLKDTGRNLIAFLKANPNTYHSYEANELVGDLLVATGNYAGAEPYYLALKQAKWADYRMRAAVAMGRALLAQNKAAEAAKAFDDVINGEGAGDLAELQRLTAKLGKARATAATGQGEQAVKTIQEIISKIDPDNNDLHAQAYNALGYALRKSNKPKEALLAFLHVDLLYSNSPDAHAEALANMTMLFKELYKPDHARRARATLMQRYGASSWANSVR
jgi:tetratricopeptide (TPR) repeat protein